MGAGAKVPGCASRYDCAPNARSFRTLWASGCCARPAGLGIAAKQVAVPARAPPRCWAGMDKHRRLELWLQATSERAYGRCITTSAFTPLGRWARL